MANTLVYLLDNKIYINLTNRCTNNCIFCLRNDKDDVCGQKLWLDTEDFAASDVIEQFQSVLKKAGTSFKNEAVFCGYGEPLLKLEILKETAGWIKKNYPEIKTRINTNGHANFVYKRNVAPDIAGLIDEVSVSLNAPTSDEYNELSNPKIENAYDEVKKFIKSCSDAGIKTVTSVVENYKGRHLDIAACEKISEDLGAKLRVREWIPNGYS